MACRSDSFDSFQGARNELKRIIFRARFVSFVSEQRETNQTHDIHEVTLIRFIRFIRCIHCIDSFHFSPPMYRGL